MRAEAFADEAVTSVRIGELRKNANYENIKPQLQDIFYHLSFNHSIKINNMPITIIWEDNHRN